MSAPLSPEREAEFRERLASTLAVRKSDAEALLAELDRLRAELAAKPADFYRPGHIYTNAEFPQYGWKFRCDTVTTHPEDGERTALGWRFFNGKWDAYAYGEDDWDIHLYYATRGGAS
jgi:hypothetical protein